MRETLVAEPFHDDDRKNTRYIRVVDLGHSGFIYAVSAIPYRKGNTRTDDGVETAIIASSDHSVYGAHLFVDSSLDRQLIVLEVLTYLDG